MYIHRNLVDPLKIFGVRLQPKSYSSTQENCKCNCNSLAIGQNNCILNCCQLYTFETHDLSGFSDIPENVAILFLASF